METICYYNENPLNIGLIKETWEKAFNGTFNQIYWEWRFLQNPFESSPNIAYYMIDGKLASYYALSESRFILNGVEIKAGLINMVMTHPDFAGMGLFAKLEKEYNNKLLNTGYSFLYGFANHNAHRIHRKHAGWRDLFILNNFLALSESIVSKHKIIDKKIRFQDDISTEDDLRKFEPLKYSGSNSFFLRNENFISWRFINNPVNKYYFLKIFENDKLIGICIYKKYVDSIDIMEIFYCDEVCRTDVIKNAVIYLANKSSSISVWSNLHSEEHIYLESLCFQEKNFNTYFGYIPNNDKFCIDHSDIHLRYTDSDVY